MVGNYKSNHHTPVTNVSRQWREWCHKKGAPQGCPSEIHTAQSLTYMTWSTARSVDRTDHHACVNVPILCAIQSDTARLKIKKKTNNTYNCDFECLRSSKHGGRYFEFSLRVDFACANIRTVATKLKYLCCPYKNKIERYRPRRCR